MVFKIFCDGSAIYNGSSNSKGGWGYVAINGDGVVVKEACGGRIGATNNQMELEAFIYGYSRAITGADLGEHIEVYSDSAYIINCLNNRWYEKWERNGWKTSDGKDVKNKDLWMILIADIKKYGKDDKFIKVKGHSGNTYNERADELARIGAQNAKKSS